LCTILVGNLPATLMHACPDPHRYVESCHGDGATSDVEVRVGDASFLAHTFVLGQAPFFHTKFASAVGENDATQTTCGDASDSTVAPRSTRAVVTLPPEEVTPDAFKVVLELLYKVDTAPTFPCGLKLLEVHAAAPLLLLTVLPRTCEEALEAQELSLEVLLPYLRYANLHGLKKLKGKCFEYATESGAQLGDFMVTEGYAEMVVEDRELFLEFVEHLRTAVHPSEDKKRKR